MQQRIAIIGAGRVGSVLATALHECGLTFQAVVSRSADSVAALARLLRVTQINNLSSCTHALVAVPDSAVHEVVSTLSNLTVLHTSGAIGPVLHAGVLHPLQTFPNRSPMPLGDCTFAYGGGGDTTESWALQLVVTMKAHAIKIRPGKWASYHAAAVFASNYQVTLLDCAFELMASAGVEQSSAAKALRPLAETAVRNALNYGPAAALTGPIRRSDLNTVGLHLESMTNSVTRRFYAAAAQRTLPIAAQAGVPTEAMNNLLKTVLP